MSRREQAAAKSQTAQEEPEELTVAGSLFGLKRTTVEFENGKIGVTYDVSAIPLGFMDRLQNTKTEAEAAELLVRVVRDWTLARAPGEKWPLTVEAVLEAPFAVVWKVLAAVGEDPLPNGLSSPRSSPG